MLRQSPGIFTSPCQKAFSRAFAACCIRRHPWDVWSDFLSAASCELSVVKEDWQEQEYSKAMKENPAEFADMFTAMVEALDVNRNQDFLGEMFMRLDMGDTDKGQFFTPYDVTMGLARITIGREETLRRYREQGVLSVYDSACGAGATLIAAHNVLMEYGIPQLDVFYHGQDLSAVAAKMCHIQLSLLGCVGVICIGNTLTAPARLDCYRPVRQEGNRYLFTPMYFSDHWQSRIRMERMKGILDRLTASGLSSEGR